MLKSGFVTLPAPVNYKAWAQGKLFRSYQGVEQSQGKHKRGLVQLGFNEADSKEY
jgi:hypothetical protein